MIFNWTAIKYLYIYGTLHSMFPSLYRYDVKRRWNAEDFITVYTWLLKNVSAFHIDYEKSETFDRDGVPNINYQFVFKSDSTKFKLTWL